MNQDYFTWVPFYSEFAEKLLSFAKDRSSLIEKIKAVYTAINMRLPKLEKDDHIVDIDPFTVFGLFNKGITDASRIAILQGIANEFSIKAAVPQAFNGIPVLNNQKATFYYFISDRKDDDTPCPQIGIGGVAKSVLRTYSCRMKFCVQRGLGALPPTSRRQEM
ncbi:MAG: hypothetical protein UGF45_14230 [Massilioclostridium sp.]|nr:hypothetical protein [Massilioclostridium sp.]